MLEGKFHGNGELRFPDGHLIKGVWNQGFLANVERHIFSDGLDIDTINWNYCQNNDRRFQDCRLNGLPGVFFENLNLPSQLNKKVSQNNVGAKTSQLFSFIDSSKDEN